MPSRPSMKSHSTTALPARPLKKPLKGLPSGTPKERKPSVGLPPLIHAAGPNRSRVPSWS